MGSNNYHYLVYRVYSHNERPGSKGNNWLYGWTNNKSVLKAFLKQRDEKKYLIFKMTLEEIGDEFSENSLVLENMISFIRLKSALTLEEYCLFMTMNEMQEVEKKIQRMFHEMSSIERINGKGILYYVNMILNLDDHYLDALHYIGYRPPEIEDLFDSVYSGGNLADLNGVCDQIDLAYEGSYPNEYYNDPIDHVPGLSTIEDDSRLILYSIESFIKVLKDDL